MPRTIEVKLYQFNELETEAAKEKAREWYRQHVFTESYDWEHVYEDADRMGKMFGIELDGKPIKMMNGKTRYEPCIWFSGFSSQGDGACFEGDYRYKAGGVKAVMSEAPKDEDLHSIAKRLQEVQKRFFYKLRARTKHRGHYYHSGCMDVEVWHDDDEYRDIGDAESEVRDLLREFADWIYENLEKQHDYLMSDESVDESITANEYEFNEDGSRA